MTADKQLGEALRLVHSLGTGPALTRRIAQLERLLSDEPRNRAVELCTAEGIDEDILLAALLVKEVSGQINTVLHAIGILASLPYILERDEVIESLSLGAGNIGKAHDLETDRRIAEFKFVRWSRHDTIRQNNLFADLVGLACAETRKRRELYVVDTARPERFLSGGRSIQSVLKRHGTLHDRLKETYGDEFRTVGAFWERVKDQVPLIDLRPLVPSLGA